MERSIPLPIIMREFAQCLTVEASFFSMERFFFERGQNLM